MNIVFIGIDRLGLYGIVSSKRMSPGSLKKERCRQSKNTLPALFFLAIVVKVEFIWMRSELKLIKLVIAFPFNPCLDEVFGEYTALN